MRLFISIAAGALLCLWVQAVLATEQNTKPKAEIVRIPEPWEIEDIRRAEVLNANGEDVRNLERHIVSELRKPSNKFPISIALSSSSDQVVETVLFDLRQAGWVASRCINPSYIYVDIPRTQQQTPLTPSTHTFSRC